VQNNSGKWWMLSRGGLVVEGEGNPDAVMVLAAPGSEIPRDVIDKYDLSKRLDRVEPDRVDRPKPKPDDLPAKALTDKPKPAPAKHGGPP